MGASDFPIVGIGASAGGLDAFHAFFDHMPADCDMAFVMVLHLPADRKSMLAEILSRWTAMPVKEGVDGALIEPNCVYVPPPHAMVTLADGRLIVRTAPENERIYQPIDGFFDALASSLGEYAVGVVLSGTGSDGALGLKAIKEAGGFAVVQGSDGTAPQYGDMPAHAIATGAVDLIAPVEDIPRHLLRLRKNRATSVLIPEESASTDAARLKICAILRGQLGHDFSGYRDKTFLRRVQRRMQVASATTLEEYIARLQADRDEVVLLFRDLLIRVTSFFRDKETFQALERTVIPRLFSGKEADGRVRVWVPGCATGEEAYSLAILLREHMDKLRAAPRVQVFATDIDESAISTARLGRYPKTLLEGLSDEHRERYFTSSQGSFVVSKEIRDLCTFSPHNVVRDPPFSRMDLVSCRNLLIYMNKDLQATVIPDFHYALVSNGILLLGGSESASQQADLFEPIDKAARIFVRRNVRSPALRLEPQPHRLPIQPERAGVYRAPIERGRNNSGEQAARNDQGQWLSTKGGDDGTLRPGLRQGVAPSPWRRFLERCFPAVLPNARLHQQFLSSHEQFQALQEEHQTALEELRSSNEELHSVNEEMQSANEELETSKEELQSLNEELHTSNMQLNEKVDELNAANSDLRNLFESTDIATIFLDRHLIIRSFTPAIATLYNLIPSDQGRPVTDIVSQLRYSQLTEDVTQVLYTLQPLERRITRADRGAHYIMRILPYRESDSTVSGVLVTFIDVTSIVQAEEALVQADVRKDVFLATLSHELRNPLAPIRSAARLLEASKLDPPQARAQAIISRQVAIMSSLLDDLLDVSRITRGSFLLKKEHVEIKSLMEAAVEAVQPAVDAKRHTLRVEWPPVRTVLEVDALRLTQVLSNLLMNAVKYTPPGGLIGLGYRLEPQAIIFCVRDDGLGLAADMLSQVFTMFTRVESDTGRAEGGLGIGLALAKGLVELHGGQITAHSEGLGKGCEFVVSLPRSLIVVSAEPSPGARRNGNGLTAKRVLIADDNRDGAETLGLFLEMQGHEIHFAHTGGETLAVAAAVKPEIGVIDIGMPDMSGYEVAERIRHEAWGEHITLIALTGWGQESDKRRALAAGFDHHCTKPVDPAELERFFARRESPR
jgi:two-component system CheB/CheR fusion protein